jgi:hypothetical protein
MAAAVWADAAEPEKGPAKEPAAVNDAAAKPGDAVKKVVLTEPVVVKLEEAPAFGKEQTPGQVRYPQGQYASCRIVPDPRVKAYPKLNSKRPLYGTVTFDADYYQAKAEVTYHFVVDESAEPEKKPEPAKTEKKPGEAKQKKSDLLASIAKALVGGEPARSTPIRPDQVKNTYDLLLYFDRNGDLDLTNDGVIKRATKPAFEGVPEQLNTCCFDELALTFDFGPAAGKRPVALVPRLQVVYGPNYGNFEFIAKTGRKGKVRLGDQDYVVWLRHQSGTVSGRFDQPYVQVQFPPVVPAPKEPPLLRSGPLCQMQLVASQFLTLSASPLGDELTITPYTGDLGVLEIAAGGRAITEFGAIGQLQGRTTAGRMTIVPLGQRGPRAPETLPRSYQVPVGDYTLPTVIVQYGRLRFNARVLPSSGQTVRSSPYAVQIRKDKPFVLAFSGKAEIKFMSPEKSQSFKPGDSIYIGAMLNEPGEGMQITGLWDTTEKKGTMRYVVDGNVVTVPEYATLDPTIVIRNAAGEEVTKGKMPFG